MFLRVFSLFILVKGKVSMEIREQTKEIMRYTQDLMNHVLKLGYEYKYWWNYSNELQSFYIVLRIGTHDSGTPRGFCYRLIERYIFEEYIKSIQDPNDISYDEDTEFERKQKLIMHSFIFAMVFAVSLYEFNLEENPGYEGYAKFIEKMSNESEFFKETLNMVKREYKYKPLNLWEFNNENDSLLIHPSISII